jgi:molecular chaperone DnaK (HSP70)
LSLPISRAKFEELNLDLFKRTLAPVAQVRGREGGSGRHRDGGAGRRGG